MSKINIVCTVLLILNILFIVFQAQQDGTKSSESSSQVVDVAVVILDAMDVSVERDILHSMLRELAHVIQYFTLGLWAACLFMSRKYLLYLGGLVMVLDEVIQHFTPGRVFQLEDLGLDTMGYALAILCVYGVIMIFKGVSQCVVSLGMSEKIKRKTSS